MSDLERPASAPLAFAFCFAFAQRRRLDGVDFRVDFAIAADGVQQPPHSCARCGSRRAKVAFWSVFHNCGITEGDFQGLIPQLGNNLRWLSGIELPIGNSFNEDSTQAASTIR